MEKQESNFNARDLAVDALRSARKLPVGPDQLRQRAISLRWLERKELSADALKAVLTVEQKD
jgi:hypothetical protein